jgi:outer membrane protein insertion porin family
MTSSASRCFRRAAALLLCVLLTPLSALEPPLAAVSFEGDLPLSLPKARRIVGLPLGVPFDPAAAQAASARLMEALRNEHHPLARVRWKAAPVVGGDGLALVFIAEPGPKGRLTELRFTGNQALSSDTLRDAVTLRPRDGVWNRVTGRDVMLLEELQRDQEALLRRYQEAGHMDAEIGSPDLEWLGDGLGFRLTWDIPVEGPVYRIRTITFQGDKVPVASALTEVLGLRSGETVSPALLRQAGERLRDLLIERGHGFATVTLEPTWDLAAARADLVFDIRSGPVPRLRDIRLKGNSVTRDRILLREIPLRPGEVFQAEALRAAQDNLEATGLFSEVDVQYSGAPGAAEFDVDVHVREKETGRAEMGLTYGSVEGAAFLIQVREHNLALGDPWRGQALQTFAAATLGSEILRLETGLRNPRLGTTRWGLGGTVFSEDNQYLSDSYDQKSQGAQLTLSHPLGPFHLLSAAYAWTVYDVYNIDPLSLPDLNDEDTDVNLTSLLLSWAVERVDQDFRPTRGVRMVNTVGYGTEALGGDTEVIQYDGRTALYLNPVGEHVLVLRAGASSVDPQGDTPTVPLPLRVWLGGANNLRGFRYRSVSPFDADGDPIGGESAWWGGAEYMVPVFPRLDVSLYYDVGDVSPDAWSFSGDGPASNWGIGFLIRAQNFPIRFDIAFPLDVLDGDRSNESGDTRFSFSAGYTF